MTGRLILFAHAETEATRTAAFPLDESLSAAGSITAARGTLPLPRHDRACRSPARAAAETAEVFGLSCAIDPMLADLDCGLWRGKTLAAVAEQEPESLGAWLSDPTYAGHGGTSISDVLSRVSGWLTARLDHRGTTLAITHAAVVRCAILATLGAPTAGFWSLDVAPLTRAILSTDGRRWALRALQPTEPLR